MHDGVGTTNIAIRIDFTFIKNMKNNSLRDYKIGNRSCRG